MSLLIGCLTRQTVTGMRRCYRDCGAELSEETPAPPITSERGGTSAQTAGTLRRAFARETLIEEENSQVSWALTSVPSRAPPVRRVPPAVVRRRRR